MPVSEAQKKATARYEKENYDKVYAIDIVDHFPELEAELNDYIDGLYQIALE